MDIAIKQDSTYKLFKLVYPELTYLVLKTSRQEGYTNFDLYVSMLFRPTQRILFERLYKSLIVYLDGLLGVDKETCIEVIEHLLNILREKYGNIY